MIHLSRWRHSSARRGVKSSGDLWKVFWLTWLRASYRNEDTARNSRPFTQRQ